MPYIKKTRLKIINNLQDKFLGGIQPIQKQQQKPTFKMCRTVAIKEIITHASIFKFQEPQGESDSTPHPP